MAVPPAPVRVPSQRPLAPRQYFTQTYIIHILHMVSANFIYSRPPYFPFCVSLIYYVLLSQEFLNKNMCAWEYVLQNCKIQQEWHKQLIRTVCQTRVVCLHKTFLLIHGPKIFRFRGEWKKKSSIEKHTTKNVIWTQEQEHSVSFIYILI